jgi:hypothetical protein
MRSAKAGALAEAATFVVSITVTRPDELAVS